MLVLVSRKMFDLHWVNFSGILWQKNIYFFYIYVYQVYFPVYCISISISIYLSISLSTFLSIIYLLFSWLCNVKSLETSISPLKMSIQQNQIVIFQIRFLISSIHFQVEKNLISGLGQEIQHCSLEHLEMPNDMEATKNN